MIQLDRRDEALHALRAEGIEVQIGTYALHHLGAYRDRGSFPGADRAFARALALPFASDDDRGRVRPRRRGARPLRLAGVNPADPRSVQGPAYL